MNSINTGKNVSEIVSSLRAKGFQLDMIPSDISDGIRSSFSAILHSGNGGMLGSHNEPGVKVAIYDLGNSRRVELEALSTSPMGQKFNLKKGEQLCDQLYAELNEGSSVSEPQVEEPAPVSDPTFAPIANDTPAEPEKDDFSKKFMKGFKKISPTAPSAPVAPEPTPVSVAGAAAGFKEMPKPDYVKRVSLQINTVRLQTEKQHGAVRNAVRSTLATQDFAVIVETKGLRKKKRNQLHHHRDRVQSRDQIKR